MFNLNREQIPLVSGLVLAAVSLGLYLGLLWVSWGPVLRSQSLLAARIERPVALDFPLHWTASYLALAGEPATVYDYARLRTLEKELTGGGPSSWPYPPTALLIVYPLALAPYFISLAIWLAVTLGLYLLVLYKIAPRPFTIFWVLTFLGTFANLAFGQNGYISAALLGGGLLFLESSPPAAGILLGLLSYKPHLAALIPLALLAGRRWRPLMWALVSGMGLILVSVAVFGVDIWRMFLESLPNTLTNLYTETTWFYKMVSVFAVVRLAGWAASTAWIFQGAAMLAAVVLVVWTWSGPASLLVKGAGLVVAILLFSPHIWYYDLTLLAIPLAGFWWQGLTKGWLPWEKMLLILSWIMPALGWFLSMEIRCTQGPLYLVPLTILLIRRYFWEQGQGWESGGSAMEISGK